jgi:hypothetical protein
MYSSKPVLKQCSALTELCMVTKTSMEKCSAHMKLADSAGKLKAIGLGDMLMLWDGNVSDVLFEAGSEAVLSSQRALHGHEDQHDRNAKSTRLQETRPFLSACPRCPSKDGRNEPLYPRGL